MTSFTISASTRTRVPVFQVRDPAGMERGQRADKKMARENAGFMAFRQLSGSLLRAIQDPMTLAWDLNSKGLIDSQVREQACLITATVQQRVSCLLGALEGKIASDEAAFDTFLSVLSQDPVMEEMWRKLKDARGIYNL